jgi:hypothetical protein
MILELTGASRWRNNRLLTLYGLDRRCNRISCAANANPWLPVSQRCPVVV